MPQLSRVVFDSEQAMSIKYNNLVYDMKLRGEDILVMSLGEAFFDIPLFDFSSLKYPEIYHYSHSRGIIGLRKKICDYFLKSYDFSVNSEEEIIVTAGSKAAIHFALMSILNPGDEVIIPEPAWVSYPEQVKLAYGNPVKIPVGTPITDYEHYLTQRTKAIIINNPHNPTGYVYKDQELKYLLEICRKHNLWLLSDEAYSDFVKEENFISLGSIDREKTHSIIFNSISKNYGISGWRLGYIIGNKSLINGVLKVNQHLITCPATILELYVEKYFQDILDITLPQISSLLDHRKELSDFMKKIGLNKMDGTATFYFFVSILPSRLNSEEFCTKLLQEGKISTVPGKGYGDSCDKYIRVSFGTASMRENKRGLLAIKQMIEATSL